MYPLSTTRNLMFNAGLLLFVFSVSVADESGQSVEVLAVTGFDFCPPPENVLELVDDRLLGLQPTVQTFELVVELNANVWKKTNRKNVDPYVVRHDTQIQAFFRPLPKKLKSKN